MTVSSSAYDISVVIPLYDKRIDEKECFDSWCHQQSLDRDRYEVIVVSNGESPDADSRIKELIGKHDLFLSMPGGNMSDLYDLGARSARGNLLLLTELHCVAKPDFLEKVVEYMDVNDVDGACVRTDTPVQNTFGQVEASLFDDLFEEWSGEDDWRKVLVRGFAIYKDKYISAGGIDGRYPRFADWVLAARLHAQGSKLGYAKDAGLIHYYSTQFSQFFPNVRVHIQDECRFRDIESEKFCNQYFGIPPDWSLRNTYNRPWHLKMLKLHLRLITTFGTKMNSGRKFLGLLSGVFHHGAKAILGLLPKLAVYNLKLYYYKFLCLFWKNNFNKLKSLYLKSYHSIEDYYRLEYINSHSMPTTRPVENKAHHCIADIDVTSLPGFYSVEEVNGDLFRWSTGAAEIVLGMEAGNYRLTFDTKNIIGKPCERLLGVFFNEHYLDIDCGMSENGKFSVRIDSSMFLVGSTQLLQILVVPAQTLFNVKEKRRLGLPLFTMDCLQE